jgi:lysophospholipase L1-like esterase
MTNNPARAKSENGLDNPVLPRVSLEIVGENGRTKNNLRRHVLYIGDSQSTITPLGEMLKSFIREEFNYRVTLASAAGSSPRHWGAVEGKYKDWLCSRDIKYLSEDNVALGNDLICENHRSVFESLIIGHNPSIVLLQFLGNSVRFHDKPKELKSFIFQLLHQIPQGTDCLWVTSPPAEKLSNNRTRLATQSLIADLLDQYANRYGTRCEIISGLNDITLAKMVETDTYYIDGFHLSEIGADYFLNRLKDSLKDFFSNVL